MASEKKPRKQRRIVELTRSDLLWQALREKLVGRWVKEPRWCLDMLESYLESPTRGYDEPSCQIVFNYLTSSGFRSGVITRSGSSAHLGIAKLRKIVEQLLVDYYEAKPLQMMPTHDHADCKGLGCADCKFSGIIPGKKSEE